MGKNRVKSFGRRRFAGFVVRNYLMLSAVLGLSHFGLSWLHSRVSGRANL